MPDLIQDDLKDKVINETYRNPATGYGSVLTTFRNAKEKLRTITYQYTKNWFERKVEKTKQVPGMRNSFVAQRAGQEIELDVFYITDATFPNQHYPYGLSAIDVFSKRAAVIPMKKKNFTNIAPAILQAFKIIGKQPDAIYTDDDGALTNKEANDFFDELNIQRIVTSSSKPHFVERFHRTFKNLLHKRVTNYTPKKRLTEKTTLQWSDFVKDVLDTYNNTMVHAATGMTPLSASRKGNELDAKTSMELRAQRGRRYPTLNVGDEVRILKSKRKVTKETTNKFKEGTFTVESISENFGQKFYKLNNGHEYIRVDLVKL